MKEIIGLSLLGNWFLEVGLPSWLSPPLQTPGLGQHGAWGVFC